VSTVLSVLTPAGRGAVAVVAVTGPQAIAAVDRFFRARNRRLLSEQSVARILYGNWAASGEDLVVCRRAADLVEIHCHGGSQAVAKITSDLCRASCSEIPWQDWLARQSSDALETEAQIALARAASTRSAAILLDQFHGALQRELVEICSLLKSDAYEARERLTKLHSTAPLGLHLTHPWQVVIAGKPNVGKSSLINALVGYRRAIVFDQPGTTRDVVTAATVIEGWPVTLSDTAGLHAASDALEAAGIELARERLAAADLVVWVVDASEQCPGSWQDRMNREVAELALSLPEKQLLVLNKIDRVDEIAVPTGTLATSATTGVGVEQLLAAISTTLVPEVPSHGAAVLFTDRQRVAVTHALDRNQQGNASGAAELLGEVLAN
jgi:tRNA modification GTPase